MKARESKPVAKDFRGHVADRKLDSHMAALEGE
jgi:hypothetical protein